jgi:hypothetical protein
MMLPYWKHAAWLLALVLLSVPEVSAEGGAGLEGKRVWIQTTDSGDVVGQVVGVGADALLIRKAREATATRIAREDVRRLFVSRGYRRHTLLGLAGGALGWIATVGVVAAVNTLGESGVGELWFIASMVLTGGVVGTLVKTERWDEQVPFQVSLLVEPRRRGGSVQLVLRF